jgi:hypothetical protein
MQDVEPGARKYGVRYERGVMPHELYEDTPSRDAANMYPLLGPILVNLRVNIWTHPNCSVVDLIA